MIIDDENAAFTFRYRLLDSIRAFALEAATEAGQTEPALAAHARWFADVAAASTEGVRSRHQGEHLAVARTERANIDAALAWSAAHDPQLALDIVNGFGWAWVVLGDSRGRATDPRRPRRGRRRRTRPRPRRRAPARGMDRGVDR